MKIKTLVLLPLLLVAPTIVSAADVKTDKQKLSYILGVQVGQGLKAEGIELEMDAFSAGIKDMMEGNKPKIDQATAQKLVQDYQQQKQANMAETAAKKQKQADAFLAKNAKEKGVVVTATGLQYKVLEQGKGKSPTSEDKSLHTTRASY